MIYGIFTALFMPSVVFLQYFLSRLQYFYSILTQRLQYIYGIIYAVYDIFTVFLP